MTTSASRRALAAPSKSGASLAVQMTAAAQRRLDRGEHRAAGVAGVSWRLSYYDGWVTTVA